MDPSQKPAQDVTLSPSLVATLGPRLMVVAAHADDIEITCGGTVRRYIREGGKVLGCVLTSPTHPVDSQKRIKESRESARVLGYTLSYHLLPDTRLPQFEKDGVDTVESDLRLFKPTAVLTHFHGDTHQDHAAAHRITMAACRLVPTVLEFQPTYPSGRTPVAFKPDVYVPFTSEDMALKTAALSCHESQAAKYGKGQWFESIKAIAQANSWQYCGIHGFAEVFSAARLSL